jgi:Uma2 family endonuclease
VSNHATNDLGIVAVVTTAPTSHRFTVEDWDRLIEVGFFTKYDRVELLDGEIFDITPIGDPHEASVDRLTRHFVTRAGERAIVRIQGSVQVSKYSVPLPDVAVLAPRDDFYRGGKPQPDDLLLVIEVSDSSLAFDRGPKARLYAAGGVAEYWVVDVNGEVVDVCTEPSADGYRSVSTVGRGATLAPICLPGVSLTVDEILGPPAA